MDITLFIIIVIVIVFIYYLINTIKDLQIEIKNMSMSCNKNSTDNIKPLETMEVKMKNDFILLLDHLKNYFI
jgi:hypothetical protein